MALGQVRGTYSNQGGSCGPLCLVEAARLLKKKVGSKDMVQGGFKGLA